MFKFEDERDWFFEKRFGMFIHWGLYAIHGLHEQEQWRYAVPSDEYVRLIEHFNPIAFNPEEWLDLAADTGMDYLVLTAKHHDGFCLWNTECTGFNVANTPYKCDIVGELASACHERDFPLEIYYSIVDWHCPSYPNLGRHHEIVTDNNMHNWDTYMEFLKAQITELCRNYGKIHGIWWDMNVPEHRDPSVHELIRKLQPAAVINNRGFDEGDYSTPERDYEPGSSLAFEGPAESCQSVGVNSWGYRKNEDYFSVTYFLRNIARTLARGGNYLLNVGPDSKGIIPAPAQAILRGIGAWYHLVKEALVASPSPGLIENSNVLVTQHDNSIYIICPDGLESSSLSLRPLDRKPSNVILLNTGMPVEYTFEPIVYERHLGPALRLTNLPADELISTVPVFKLSYT